MKNKIRKRLAVLALCFTFLSFNSCCLFVAESNRADELHKQGRYEEYYASLDGPQDVYGTIWAVALLAGIGSFLGGGTVLPIVCLAIVVIA